MLSTKSLKLAKIIWVDSGLTIDESTWYDKDELKKEAQDTNLVITTGFILLEDDEHIVVTHSSDGNLYRGGFRILKSCIVKIDVLEEIDVLETIIDYKKKVSDMESTKNKIIAKKKKKKKTAKKNRNNKNKKKNKK